MSERCNSRIQSLLTFGRGRALPTSLLIDLTVPQRCTSIREREVPRLVAVMGANDETQAFVHLAGSESTRLYFSGPPHALTGIIQVVNTSSEKQKTWSIAIKCENLRGAGGVPLREIPFRTRLRGAQQVNLRARVPLDPQTPPGRYDFEVTLGSRTLPATAYVPEVVDLRVEPRAITIIASAKNSSYTKTMVCENKGNVVLLLGSRCEVPLFEAEPLDRALLNGLNKGDRKSVESMAKAALNELADLKVGTLVIKRKAIALSPGEKLAVDFTFQLPEGLRPQRHYSVSAGLYNANLGIDIYTTTKPEPASSKRK
jgi:hypothetical protein